MATDDRLEILSVSLLENKTLVNEMKQIAAQMRVEFGWHYLLDLVWIIECLDLESLANVLDAGAGRGVIQFFLASKGINVVSVDRVSRAYLPLHFRKYCQIEGFTPEDLASPAKTLFRLAKREGNLDRKVREFVRDLVFFPAGKSIAPGSGKVLIYQQDLKNLKKIEDNSMDAVVAVSALEHNLPEDLPQVVAELMRVLKPGGRLVATLSTSGSQDQYHQPSSGWTYCEASLKAHFGLDADVISNYDQLPALFEDLRHSTELKEGLAKFYFQRGEGGMPWGVWDPQYVPVGVCKVKPLAG
ncbi:MAG: methyltransferase domain-containing protein [Anaerolineales bacterium]|nr:methyltransferase domain-containing protein [Anaerolineales bacterium]